MKTPAKGSCQCRSVMLTINADPIFHYACHCHSCKKRTGSGFSMGVVVTTESLTVTGELTPWSRVSEDGNTNTRYSCAACGNIIYGIGDTSPELAKVQSGLPEDTSDVEPEVRMWASLQQPWVTLPEFVTGFETQPENALELLQAALDYRARA
ncbi:MAG: hypothetical protein ACI9NT_000438 [Bacteroidia bacterium]|jgi:hypothetical protein